MKNYIRGDVFLVDLDDTNSHVQSGKRPCLIVQNNLGNSFSPNLIVVPLTSKLKKKNMSVHVVIDKNEMALCECILTISKTQLIYYIKTLDEKTMNLIDRALSISLGIEREEKLLKV